MNSSLLTGRRTQAIAKIDALLFEGTQPRRAVLKCTKIVESSDDSHTPEVRATIVSCGPTALLVVRRARIVAAQLDMYRPSPWPYGESARTALFPSS